MTSPGLVFVAIGFMACSCSNRLKYYHDFSFMVNEVVALDTSLINSTEQIERAFVGNLDSCFTYMGTLSTTYDIRYQIGYCSDSMYIVHGRDTFLLQEMLGPDSVHIGWFTLRKFGHVDLYRLQNRISKECSLFLSWGHDNFGNAPGSRINFVFPLSENDRIDGAFAYITNTSTLETYPCLDCFTDYNRDGKTDFVRWIYGGDNSPVEFVNFSRNGQRVYHRTGYKSIYRYNGLGWDFIQKGKRLNR